MQQQQLHQYSLVDNNLNLQDTQQGLVSDGIELSAEQQQYLLPHFLMLLVGKPGSGKTTIMKQMITNPQLYKRKFDKILVISPSFNKTGIKLEKRYVIEQFDLGWIYTQISKINQEQINKIFGHDKGARNTPKDYKISSGARAKTVSRSYVMGDTGSRFLTADFLKANGMVDHSGTASSYSSINTDDRAQMDELYKTFKQMPVEVQKKTHVNVLLVLDDVVADIKKNENNPKLGALIMNRRHQVFNGTLSIIMVTQKYTLIPARIRSNANWLILFQLNPLDFESVFRDVVVEDLKTWREILSFVFGRSAANEAVPGGAQKGGSTGQRKRDEKERSKGQLSLPMTAPKQNPYEEEIKYEEELEEEQKEEKSGTAKQKKSESDTMKALRDKKYDNLSIWVEFNIMFKNFKRIEIS